jgi:hypothetical protein
MFDLFSIPNHDVQSAVLPVDNYPTPERQLTTTEIVYATDNYPNPPEPSK